MDINRNYGYHYGSTPEDNDVCSETYRGKKAFSEPETRAIRDLLEKYPNINSCMNFHSYGNMLIHPFNYLTEKGIFPGNIEQKYIDFYN